MTELSFSQALYNVRCRFDGDIRDPWDYKAAMAWKGHADGGETT